MTALACRVVTALRRHTAGRLLQLAGLLLLVAGITGHLITN